MIHSEDAIRRYTTLRLVALYYTNKYILKRFKDFVDFCKNFGFVFKVSQVRIPTGAPSFWTKFALIKRSQSTIPVQNAAGVEIETNNS